jgi:hypothetical protein
VYGQADAFDVTVYPWSDPGAPLVARGYRVDTECSGDGRSCSTGVTEPVITLAGLPSTVVVGYRFNGGSPTTKFSNMPIGVPVDVTARLCVVFNSTTSQCSTANAPVPPDPGYASYRTQVAVKSCVVGTAPSVAVSASSDDYVVEWTLRNEGGSVTTNYNAMRTATVKVTFINALAGINPWTSSTDTCSGVPDPTPTPTPTPDPSPSVSPTP